MARQPSVIMTKAQIKADKNNTKAQIKDLKAAVKEVEADLKTRTRTRDNYLKEIQKLEESLNA